MSNLINKTTLHSEQVLVTPHELIKSQPLTANAFAMVEAARQAISAIIQGKDNRLLVIAGPCSIHDPHAAIEYATHLKAAADKFADELCIIMRVYFEKPRTTVGWKGLISDPWLDGSFDINQGLTIARKLLLDLAHLGIPAGTEFLDTIIPVYLSDLMSWCAVGARTVESQTHRELASGLPMPVGFKNNTDGNIKVAIDAVNVAQHSHSFLSINQQGTPVTIYTKGNPDCHIILRGSNTTSNYSPSQILKAATLLQEAQLMPKLMVDCSHGNSMKNYQSQHKAILALVEQLKNGSPYINGIMLESNLIAGKQELKTRQTLIYGQSITDGCIGLNDTLELLEKLAFATKANKRITTSLLLK